MSTRSAGLFLAGALALGAPAPALAAGDVCPGTSLPAPRIAPVISTTRPIEASDAAYDCMMWQTFIYLNWPARPGRNGVPDAGQIFGAPAASVWESFKTVDEVFLPHGAPPEPWDERTYFFDRPLEALRSLVRTGALHILNQRSKVSGAVEAPQNPNSPFHRDKARRTILDDANQTDGGNLIDQNGEYVFYEMRMDQDEYNYIVLNKLYDARLQGEFAQRHGIELPLGVSTYGNVGAIEVKAAWKVLGAGDDPGRFHTARALLGKAHAPAVVGLVGLHIVQHASPVHQGIWATFAQVDNVPLAARIEERHYSFFDAACSPARCPANEPGDGTTPTQVVQAAPIPIAAGQVNALMQAKIAHALPGAPWQYYQLINVQWPREPVALPPPPQQAPLPPGSPNTEALLNPVLETFLQRFDQAIGCLSCHSMARIAEGPTPPYAAGYSFLLSHARAPQ